MNRNLLFSIFTIVFVILFVGPAVLASQTDSIAEPAGKNLVENSSFENVDNDAPSGWVQTTWSGDPVFEIETAFAHSGKTCVKIHSDEGADASWSMRLEVKPRTKYFVSAWVKTEDIEGEAYGAQFNFHEIGLQGKSDSLKGTNDWTLIKRTIDSGPHETLLFNMLFGGWGRSTGTAWFDDVEVIEIKRQVETVEMSDEEAAEFFVSTIQPILEENCFGCHGSGEKIRGEFVITNREDLLAGGESGPAVDLEDPLESLLLEAVNYETYEMPPSGKLPQADIDNIQKWLILGAPWKGDGFKPEVAEEKAMAPAVNAESKKFWSFQPPVRPELPAVEGVENKSPIDQFVIAGLQQAGLTANPRADRRSLIRRAYYDLTGLPPTPEQVAAFVSDESDEAYENLIDELLSSKHYGEKWGRHWLDIVRYGESNGYERDGTKPFVWRYRDYVIRSLNEDKPYDEFVKQQLAGDEIDPTVPDNLIATGYYRLGLWDDEPVDHKQAWFDDMDDVLKTTSDSFLGLTVGCARCHDHKIDPIPQADYYRMLAFFQGVQRYGVRSHETVLKQSTRPICPPEEVAEYEVVAGKHKKATDEQVARMKKVEEIVKKDFQSVEIEEFYSEMNRIPLVKKRVGKEIDGVEFTQKQADEFIDAFNKFKELRENLPKQLELALCVTESGANAKEMHVMIRGNAHAKGDKVEPGFPTVLSPPEPAIETPADKNSTGRRLALANWITSPSNPLTARVMVNRIWQHHFGRGIVRSTSDFGFQGTTPTHPKLLDWLAVDFIEGGWKLKRMHKLIMMSDAYCMSSANNEHALSVDPLNDKFWRYNMRRLTAEEVRDSVLAVNGTLNKDKLFGPSIFPKLAPEVLHGQSRPGENWGDSLEEDLCRRSVYIHIKRSLPVPMMAAFDVADPDTPCAVRFNTVQPTQALAMLNSDFINEEAGTLADFARAKSAEDVTGQITAVLARVTQRQPTDGEIEKGTALVKSLRESGTDEKKSLQLFCVVALNLNEFLFID